MSAESMLDPFDVFFFFGKVDTLLSSIANEGIGNPPQPHPLTATPCTASMENKREAEPAEAHTDLEPLVIGHGPRIEHTCSEYHVTFVNL